MSEPQSHKRAKCKAAGRNGNTEISISRTGCTNQAQSALGSKKGYGKRYWCHEKCWSQRHGQKYVRNET